ncbi:isoprenylcysteine carboxylmethyltransferase family protein [Listeria sp. PSOL-1]|uniref:isoprenylcysteine carboxylmethyltransferase family protein n=1 Tax=Listeria sp. PSOL-1 TaxID=1844999 RepID=UPI0013D067CE|nr:isoprenylcysteine carboxyl methyltransferase family protein [Listeria sp. PSOL-1]
MSLVILFIFLFVFITRLFFLKKSKANEKRILQQGGVEYGKINSRWIACLHTAFYLSCLGEGLLRKSSFDSISSIGVILLLFSLVMLYYVSHLLGSVWTIKLMLVKNHQYNDHWLFTKIKHPNYYCNIIPELIGLALLCHASYTFIVVFPIYLITLIIRIRQEDTLLREKIKLS